MRLCTLFFTTLLCLSMRVSADPVARFDEGLRLYRENQIEGAIDAWEGILQAGDASGPTYFNLGNAYFRKGDFGRSILNYERARAYLPRDRDLQTNLAEARRRVVDRIDPPVRLLVWDWIDSVRDILTLRELAALLQILGIIGAAVLAVRLVKPLVMSKLLGRLLLGSLALFALTGAWYGWRATMQSQPHAVIIVEKTDVYSAPDDGSKQLFALHDGTTVALGETLAGWTNIRLIDGRQGWISAADLEKI